MRNKTRGPDTTAFDLLTVEVAKLPHPISAVLLGSRMLLRRESLLSWIEQNDKIRTSPDRARKGA